MHAFFRSSKSGFLRSYPTNERVALRFHVTTSLFGQEWICTILSNANYVVARLNYKLLWIKNLKKSKVENKKVMRVNKLDISLLNNYSRATICWWLYQFFTIFFLIFILFHLWNESPLIYLYLEKEVKSLSFWTNLKIHYWYNVWKMFQ